MEHVEREHQPMVRRLGMLGGFGLLLILALIAIAPSVATASCATAFPSDSGCVQAEDWSGFTVGGASLPGDPWTWSSVTKITNTQVTSPGINGVAGKKITMTMDPLGGSGTDCIWCPAGGFSAAGFTPNGSRYWLEFYAEFSSDFQWGCGGNCSMKTIDPLGAGNYQRHLLTIWGSTADNPPYSKGHTQWDMYPNYATGGTDASGSNTATEKFANVVDEPILPGHWYRFVLEVLVGQGTAGAYKAWVCPDGGACTLTHNFTGMQTTATTGWTWNALGLGGPAAGPVLNSTWSTGRIRITTTNIAPDAPNVAPPPAVGPPPAPSQLQVSN